MNIRYASLYFVGQIWWASPKLLSRERPCCTVADCQNWRKPKAPSAERLREGLRAQGHLWPKLTAFVAPILAPKPVSGHDGRYSPEVSPRLSRDPTHYVRVREVREDEQGGIIPTQIRMLACEFPSRCCFWPDPHPRVLCRINGHFRVVLPHPPPPWRMLWLPLTMWVSLQSVRTYLSRHLKGETACLTGQTWPGSWLLGFFITYSCHCCCWLVSLLVHLVHKGLCWCC